MQIRKPFLYMAALAVSLLVMRPPAGAAEKLLFEKNSLYQYISVVEDTEKNERYIRGGRRDLSQGGISLDAPDRLLFEYSRISFISLAFLEREPSDVLFIGLGPGSMPRFFNSRYPAAQADIAEIDPDIVMVASRYFNFRENATMKISVEDGRIFVKRTKKKYDIIFLDAYQSDYIPFHLTTLEFLKEVRSRLKEGGVVVGNILSPYRNKFFDAMVATYNKAFPRVYIFKAKKAGNFVFVVTAGEAGRDRNALIQRAEKIAKSKKFGFDLAEIGLLCEHCAEYLTDAKVLTDDFAPVNLYKYQKSGEF